MTEEKAPIKLDDSNLKQILIAVLAILFTLGELNLGLCQCEPNIFFAFLVVFAVYKLTKGGRRHAILITGLCDSGKTLIFSQLLHNKFVSTFTSIKENVGEYSVKNVSYFLVSRPLYLPFYNLTVVAVENC